MVDNHQEWQSQIEDILTDPTTSQQLKEMKFDKLLEANSRESAPVICEIQKLRRLTESFAVSSPFVI